MEFILAAISLGFLGSFHCIGMCGPIALALPVHHYAPAKKHFGIFLYNIGRIFTYTFLGVLFGLLGQSFFLSGFQQALSISLGLLMLLFVIVSKSIFANGLGQLYFMQRFINYIKNQLSQLFNEKKLYNLFLIGLLNGFLPCGLVYVGIAGSIATGHYLKGGLFMFFFGTGTFFVMYAVVFFGQFINLKFRNYIRKSMPYMVSMMALLLILRGLNLGIPYISPQFERTTQSIFCCEKSNVSKPLVKCSPKKCH